MGRGRRGRALTCNSGGVAKECFAHLGVMHPRKKRSKKRSLWPGWGVVPHESMPGPLWMFSKQVGVVNRMLPGSFSALDLGLGVGWLSERALNSTF